MRLPCNCAGLTWIWGHKRNWQRICDADPVLIFHCSGLLGRYLNTNSVLGLFMMRESQVLAESANSNSTDGA